MGDSCTWGRNVHRYSLVTTFRSPYLNNVINQCKSREDVRALLVSSGKDDYENLLIHSKSMFNKINSLSHINVENKIYSITKTYSGDHMWRIAVVGHSGPASKYGDPYSILSSSLYGHLEYFASFNLMI